MSCYYAYIGGDGVCHTVAQIAGAIDAPTAIPLEQYDERYIGRRYADGVWEDVSE